MVSWLGGKQAGKTCLEDQHGCSENLFDRGYAGIDISFDSGYEQKDVLVLNVTSPSFSLKVELKTAIN